MLIRVFRDNKIASDKFKSKQKITRDILLAETGVTQDPKHSRQKINQQQAAL